MKELNELSMANNLKLEVGLLLTTTINVSEEMVSGELPLGYERVGWDSNTYFRSYSKELSTDYMFNTETLKQMYKMDLNMFERSCRNKNKPYIRAGVYLMVFNEDTETVLLMQKIVLE